jgi:hypothetical protein
MFAEHVSDQQFANEFPIQLGVQPFIPGIKYRLKHILKSHDGIVKEAMKEAEREVRRNDQQLSRLCVFKIVFQMFDECVEPRVRISKSPRCLDQPAMKPLTLVPDECVEQLILRGKVTIKCAPGYAGGLAYIEDGHTMHARSQDYILRSLENRSNGRFGTAASPAPPRWKRSRRRCRRGSALARLSSDRGRLGRLHRGLGSGSLLG